MPPIHEQIKIGGIHQDEPGRESEDDSDATQQRASHGTDSSADQLTRMGPRRKSGRAPDPNGINLRPVPSIWDEWASTWLARINIQGLKLMPFPPDPFSFPFLSGGVRLARGRC